MRKANSKMRNSKAQQPVKIMPVTKEELIYAPDPRKIKELYRSVNKNVPKLNLDRMSRNKSVPMFFSNRNPEKADKIKLNINMLSNRKQHRILTARKEPV